MSWGMAPQLSSCRDSKASISTQRVRDTRGESIRPRRYELRAIVASSRKYGVGIENTQFCDETHESYPGVPEHFSAIRLTPSRRKGLFTHESAQHHRCDDPSRKLARIARFRGKAARRHNAGRSR